MINPILTKSNNTIPKPNFPLKQTKRTPTKVTFPNPIYENSHDKSAKSKDTDFQNENPTRPQPNPPQPNPAHTIGPLSLKLHILFRNKSAYQMGLSKSRIGSPLLWSIPFVLFECKCTPFICGQASPTFARHCRRQINARISCEHRNGRIQRNLAPSIISWVCIYVYVYIYVCVCSLGFRICGGISGWRHCANLVCLVLEWVVFKLLLFLFILFYLFIIISCYTCFWMRVSVRKCECKYSRVYIWV